MALVDCDPGRGGIEVLLGIEGQQGARWADLANVRATIDPGDLTGVLPSWRDVEVLSSDRRAATVGGSAIAAVFESLVAARDVVVVDLPARALLARAGEPELPGIVAAATDVVVVTGQDVLGVSGALVVRDLVGPRARLVLRSRRRSGVAPIEAAQVLGLRLAGSLPADRRVGDAVERGLGPVPGWWSPLGRTVRRVADGSARG